MIKIKFFFLLLTESDQFDGKWSAKAYQELQENSDSPAGQYICT